MFRMSMKQLLRSPVKVLLFLLLLAGATMLLVFGSVLLIQSNQKIAAAESQFTTIGTVSQSADKTWTESLVLPDDPWEEVEYRAYHRLWTPEDLDFEGADYIQKPESRPYYMAYLPDLNGVWNFGAFEFIAEFTLSEDNDPSEDFTRVHIGKVYHVEHGDGVASFWGHQLTDVDMDGDVDIDVYNHNQLDPQPIEPGKTYIALFSMESCYNHNLETSQRLGHGYEYTISLGPNTSQLTPDGLPFDGDGSVPRRTGARLDEDGSLVLGRPSAYVGYSYMDEVTPDFWEEGGRGQIWMDYVKIESELTHYLPVLPTNSLDLLPTGHKKELIVQRGREITQEEFDSGARVCMINKEFASRNLLESGDTITLPLVYSLHNYGSTNAYHLVAPNYSGTGPLDANGQPFEPFWEDEYEIVGIFEPLNWEAAQMAMDYPNEFARGQIIIPANSVEASDENNIVWFGPMNAMSTSFQIPNGTVEAFTQKLYAAVPEAAELDIQFDDNGYSQVMQSLNKARLSAVLLFAVGVAASVAIVILLLYFFAVREKKRTAIERSMGMTKRQCRVSIVSGLLVLSVLGTALGSAGSLLLLHWNDLRPEEPEVLVRETIFGQVEVPTYAGFDTRFSVWARNDPGEDVQLGEETIPIQTTLFFAAPLLLLAVIILLSVLLVNRNLKIEPILLLSTRANE